jgi:hypothetical protein
MNLCLVPHPYPRYARKVARNSAVFWILLRLLSLFVGTASASVLTGAIVVIVTATLVWLDGQRFREHLFHANLGTSPTWAVGISFVVAGGLEILARVLLRALA